MTVFIRHPVDSPRITQPFGAKNTWEAQPHLGVDYGAPEGTPIYAPCDGFVVWASFNVFPAGNTWEMIPGSPNSGGCVIIQPPAPHTALQTSFSHMSEVLVKPGQWVTAGTMIGRVGNTGFSFGAHLHWEAFIDYAEGVYPAGTFYGRVNPLDYFNTATVVPLGTGGKGSPPAGSITPEEGNMAVQIDARQADDIANAAAERASKKVLDGILAALNKKVEIHPVQAEDIAQAAASRTLNTPVDRGGAAKGGKTSLAALVAWNDDHVIQTLAAVAATSATSGASAEQIKDAVTQALKEGVVNVKVSVEGSK